MGYLPEEVVKREDIEIRNLSKAAQYGFKYPCRFLAFCMYSEDTFLPLNPK